MSLWIKRFALGLIIAVQRLWMIRKSEQEAGEQAASILVPFIHVVLLGAAMFLRRTG